MPVYPPFGPAAGGLRVWAGPVSGLSSIKPAFADTTFRVSPSGPGEAAVPTPRGNLPGQGGRSVEVGQALAGLSPLVA